MKIIIIYGFLGSGKTTLINHLVNDKFRSDHVVVLENESGKESVDGDFLRAKGLQVVDLKAGCVCCSLRGSLADTVSDIERRISPDILLIEPSGLAALDELISIQGVCIDGVVTIIDPHGIDLLMKINKAHYEKQIRLSPIMYISKSDCISSIRMVQLRQYLTELNPQAMIVSNSTSLTTEIVTEQYRRFRSYVYLCSKHLINYPIETYVITNEVRKDQIELLFNDLNRTKSKLIRAKGFLKIKPTETEKSTVMKVDYTMSGITYEKVDNGKMEETGLTFWWYEERYPATLKLMSQIF